MQQTFGLALLAAAVQAKIIPYSKTYNIGAIPTGTPGLTTGWLGYLAINISQYTAAQPLTFGIFTGIYPSSQIAPFSAGYIYQSYLQFVGLAEDGTQNNIVCNSTY